MTKRQENALKTRQKLLDTTENLLRTKGLSALSVDEITKEAGVAKGTFYVYFKHKEDIISEITWGYYKNIENKLNSMKNSNIVEKLTVYFEEFMKAVEMYGINICREWIKSAIDPKIMLQNMNMTKWQYDVDMLKNILNNAIMNKELKKDKPVELLVHLIISQLYGMMTVWCMSDGAFEPKDWTKEFAQFQLNSILQKYLIQVR
jgi:hypothetical protein